MAPADSRQPGPPARAPTRGIAGWDPGALEGFIGTALGPQELDERQQKGHQGGLLLAALPLIVLSGGQRRQGGPERARGSAVKAARTATALPLPAQSQGDPLTPAEGRLGARVGRGGQSEHAKVIDQHVQSRQEGVHINHRRAPYCEERAMLPAGGTFRVAISGQLTPSVKVVAGFVNQEVVYTNP